MRKWYILGILVVIMSLLLFASCAPFGTPYYQQPYGIPGYQQPYPYTSPGTPNYQPYYPYGPGGGWGGWGGRRGGMMGGGMMGGGMMGGGWGGGWGGGGNYPNYQQPYPYGPGGGWGGWGNYAPQSSSITIDQAADAVRRYLSAYGGNVILTEVMEFTENFYAEVEEKDTGIHAMELLIDKFTGAVSPEMGPNMMWNTKYGMMAGMMGRSYGAYTAVMSVSAEQAKLIAQRYLDANLPGLTVEEADPFYGYYTLHTLRNNQIEGMLSVNGYTGAVWYHTWHGTFIGMKEFE